MPSFDPSQNPHRRYNPLLDEWVLCSPHRTSRPWSGQTEESAGDARPAYDPGCYLCPRNARANGAQNPDYSSTFVFDNDFAAVMPGEVSGRVESQCHGLIRLQAEQGICRVVCFSPRHDLTLAQMEEEEIVAVVDLWAAQYDDLASRPFIRAVTIFENKGEIMGCSNPHPHGQIWATESVPTIQGRELAQQEAYYREHQRPLLLDYLAWEKERVLVENEHFVALVPYWALWPYETLVLPRRAVSRIGQLSAGERKAWAAVMRELLVRYDNLFLTSFPYSMGIHQAPADGREHPEVQLHQHFFPPLLRSASIKKFQVGYEMSGEAQRDITPEQAAERLRALSSAHYRKATA